MKEKCISIITNFGCHCTCPYCIVQNNDLHIPKTTLGGLENLQKEIILNDCDMLSISGGGDPLHNYVDNIEWYESVFEIIKDMSWLRTELHTSYINMKNAPYEKFDRVVYHARTLEQAKKVKRYNNQVVRIVYVVDESFTEEKIEEIASWNESLEKPFELTFRQMVDGNYNTTTYHEEILLAGHTKRWWYIIQNDYNLYYAENKTSMKYEDFKIKGEKP